MKPHPSVTSPVKRGTDIALSGLAILLLSPIMLLTALAVALALGRPVFFRQRRPGLSGTPFEMLKFRTMTDRKDVQGRLLPDVQRLTSFGRFLRSSSLDELPELINVLKGDMSLVGPRPLLMNYLPLYSPEQARRHDVRPGITGWAQINGRNSLTWEDKFSLDVWYVRHWSHKLDRHILVKTLGAVLRREGISAGNHATMPPFQGPS
ncbi:MAG: UDP-galactose phosphate transferase [Dethiosulfovibrio peptidovorans]|nr:MAG: UDP-galactose phosphate transferase [Dethiosulfovibrio peptidovorans]